MENQLLANLKSDLLRKRNEKKSERESDREERRKIDPAQKVLLWIVAVIFFIYAATLFFPFLWMTFYSVWDKVEFSSAPLSLPNVLHFENYIDMFTEFPLTEMFVNSMVLVLCLPICGLFFTCCASYVTAKFKFRGRGLFHFIAISVMFIPTAGSLAVVYELMGNLGLRDTLLGMMVMNSGALGFNFLLLYGFFKNLPWSYAESAYIDGAGNYTVFFKIMLPQVKSILMAIWIMSVIGTWNDYMGPFLFYNSHETIAAGIKKISDNVASGGMYVLDYPKLFAAILLTTLPIIILFICSQKFIIKINMGGGIKG